MEDNMHDCYDDDFDDLPTFEDEPLDGFIIEDMNDESDFADDDVVIYQDDEDYDE